MMLMERWQVELLERMARMEETNLYIKANLSSLPQSPQCVKDIAEIKERLDDMDAIMGKINTRLTYAGGILVTIGSLLPYLIPWLIERLG